MKRRLIMCFALILAFCTSAFADPAAVPTAHSDAFGAAFTACDVPATRGHDLAHGRRGCQR
jgi:hypothetical protein